jgi:two-component system sensor histidine kinase RstB
MSWLFIRFYVGVLAVLFLAWFIHGRVLAHRSDADLARVIWEAHGGGARLVASRLTDADPDSRGERLATLQRGFAYPIRSLPVDECPPSVLQAFSRGQDAVHHREDDEHYVIANCPGSSQCVRLGPFPSYRQQEIENAIAGWMRLAAEQIGAVPSPQRQAAIDQLQDQFEIPIALTARGELPEYARGRLARGDRPVFFESEPSGSDQYYAATTLENGSETTEETVGAEETQDLRFGPFPSFERIEQKAATTTLALVLLPAALAIAVMLRPVANQLRQVENAAKSIAAGDLDARVDESRVLAARPLAHSFNLMADQTQSLLKSQRDLLQAVSHELRTPLARIRFAADLIETAKSDQERHERLQAVDDATQQLDDLVGELLTWVRADSGVAEITREEFSLDDLCEEVVSAASLLRPSLHFHVDVAAPPIVADRVALRRVISNLIRNASRFAERDITISAETLDRRVRIRIDDDGPGVAPQDRERIFRPFVRLEEESDGGTGLGLALVQRIVHSQRGEVSVGSSPTGGARFEIILPINADPRATVQPAFEGVTA